MRMTFESRQTHPLPDHLPAPPSSWAIQRGQRRLIAFHPDVSVREVDEATLRQVDPDLRALMNVNTPDELAEARTLLTGE
jgi:molybdopterin-guanine dinucleotide biosynthesis protein A